MAHPNARLINVYNGAEGIKQAPAFLRTAAAADEMEDLIVDLQGRPRPRKGYELVDLPAGISATDRQITQSLSIVFVADASGSMAGIPIEGAKAGMTRIVNDLHAVDRFGLVTFGVSARAVVNINTPFHRQNVLTAIQNINATAGSTNMYAGMQLGQQALVGETTDKKQMILLSDGLPNQGTTDPNAFYTLAEEIRNEGSILTTVALGDAADQTLLRNIALRGGGEYFFVNDPNNLPQIFERALLSRTVPGSALYTSGDQIAIAHWLGDKDTPEGIKRLYYFSRDASWVQDENGRLVYVVEPGQPPKMIDVKENRDYDWDLTAPAVVGGSQGSFEMSIVGHPPINVNRDLALIASGNVEQGGINAVRVDTVNGGAYIDIRATTDITYATLHIRDSANAVVRRLFPTDEGVGPLPQGGHRFYWDGRNDAGTPLARGSYAAVFVIDADAAGDRAVDNLRGTEGFAITGASATPSRFYLSGQFRYVCYTYQNQDLNIESLPSFIAKERMYFWHVDNETPPQLNASIAISTADAPNWATQVNIYVSEQPTPPDPEVTPEYKAIETGFDFRRIGILKKLSTQRFDSTFNAYQGEIKRAFRLLDSYDHDGPVDGLDVIGTYGIGIWGAAKNRVYFSKIGRNGEQRIYALPSENALVPHSFPLPRSGQSPILHVHPSAHEASLLVFKRDAIHIIRGKGVISGLYDPQTPVEVDLDASQVIIGTGTMSPKSVVTVGSAVYFVGSDNQFYQYGTDWRGRTDLRDVGLPIQRYLNAFDVEGLEKLVGFLWKDCYHLITPERVIIMDMSRKYWTSASWRLKDAFWSRGGVNSESILYGLFSDNRLAELFKGDTDAGTPIGGRWKSNPVLIPSESSITGIMVVHTTSPAPTIKCRVDIDDVVGEVEEFEPAAYNDFRCGTYGFGSRVAVEIISDKGFPLLDRISIESFFVR